MPRKVLSNKQIDAKYVEHLECPTYNVLNFWSPETFVRKET